MRELGGPLVFQAGQVESALPRIDFAAIANVAKTNAIAFKENTTTDIE